MPVPGVVQHDDVAVVGLADEPTERLTDPLGVGVGVLEHADVLRKEALVLERSSNQMNVVVGVQRPVGTKRLSRLRMRRRSPIVRDRDDESDLAAVLDSVPCGTELCGGECERACEERCPSGPGAADHLDAPRREWKQVLSP